MIDNIRLTKYFRIFSVGWCRVLLNQYFMSKREFHHQ